MKFNTAYERERGPKEPKSGPGKTEAKGYRPPQVQIEEFMAAGKRLQNVRTEMYYDFPAGTEVDDGYIDPTRNPNFDMADASSGIKQILEKNRAKPETVPEGNSEPEPVEEKKASE